MPDGTTDASSTAAPPLRLPPDFRPVPVAEVLVLGLVTLGLYPLVRFHQAARAYQRLAPGHPSRFAALFWGYLACQAAAVVPGAIGLVPRLTLLAGAAALGAALLADVVATRTEAIRRAGFPPPPLSPAGVFLTLWICACLTLPLGVGLLILPGLAGLFFADHNQVFGAFDRAAVSLPAPATPTYGATLPVHYCRACGGALGAAGILCTGCGKSA